MAKLLIEIDGTKAKQTAAELEKSLEKLGIAAKVVQGKMTDSGKVMAALGHSFEEAGHAIANVEKQLSAGGLRGAERAVMQARVQVDKFKDAINAARAAGSPISEKAIATLNQYERSLDSAVQRVGKLRGTQDDLRDAMSKASATTAVQNGQVTSLQSAFALLGPQMANVVGTIGSFVGALTAGVYAGNQLREGLNRITEGGFDLAVQDMLHAMAPWNAALEEGAVLARTLEVETSAAFNRIRATLAQRAAGVSLLQEWLGDPKAAEQLAATTVTAFEEMTRASSVTGDRMRAFYERVVAVENALMDAGGHGSAAFNDLAVKANLYLEAIKQGEAAGRENAAAIDKQAAAAKKLSDQLARLAEDAGKKISAMGQEFKKVFDSLWGKDVKVTLSDEALRDLESARRLTESVKTEEERHVEVMREANRQLQLYIKSQGAQGINQETYNRLLLQNRDTWKQVADEAENASKEMQDIQENFTRSVQGAFADFFTEIFTTGKVGWEDLLNTIWKLFAQTLSKMLMEWAATELKKTQTTAAQAAARRQLDSQGGSPMQGESTAGAGAGASMGSMVGYMAIFAIWAKVLTGLFKGLSGKRFQSGEASIGGGTAGNNQKMIRDAEAAVIALQESVDKIAKGLGITIDHLVAASVTIGKDEKGLYYVKTATDQFGKVFQDLNSAMEYARVQAIKFAELGKDVSAMIRTAIENTTAVDVSGLQEDIEFARRIERSGKDELQNQMDALLQQFRDDWAKAVELFRTNAEVLSQALNNISGTLAQSMREQYNVLTGHRMTREEEMAAAQQRAVLFNAQRQLILAELKLKALEVAQAIARVRAMLGVTVPGGPGNPRNPDDGSVNPGKPRPNIEKSLSGALVAIWMAELKAKSIYVAGMDELRQIELNAMQAQLDALNALIAEIEKIPIIKPEDVRLPRGGGRGTRQQRQQERQDLRDEASRWGKPDTYAAVKDVNREMADYIDRVKKAGFSAAETARLIAAATEEEKRRIEVIKQGVLEDVARFVGGPGGALGDQFRDIDGQAKHLIDALKGLRQAGALTVAEFERQREAILAAAEAQKKALAVEEFLRLAEIMAQRLGDEKTLGEIQKVRWMIELANMRAQVIYLKSLKLLNDEQVRMIDDLLGRYEAAGAPSTPGAPGVGTVGEGGGGSSIQDLYANQQAELAREQAEAMRRLTAALDRLRKLQEDLIYSAQSPLTIQQQFGAAQAAFQATSAAALAGNVQAMEQLPDVIQQFLSLASQMYGTSGAGYQTLFDQVQSILAQLLGNTYTPVSSPGSGTVVNAQGAFAPNNPSTVSANSGVEGRLDRVIQRATEIRDVMLDTKEEIVMLRTDIRRAGSL